MAIYELRTYDIKVGRLADYLAVFETRGAPVISRYAEPTGFWFTGPTESGKHERVNHIWRYDSIAARIAQRAALYADPAWTRDFVPLAFDLFERLEGRLMVLDAAAQAPLAAALAADRPRGHVVASVAPADGAPVGTLPGIGQWRFITGPAGGFFRLDFLDESELDAPESDAARRTQGCAVEIWKPARFSAIA